MTTGCGLTTPPRRSGANQNGLLLEYEVHCQNEADAGSQVIPLQLQLEGKHGEDGKHGEGDNLLNDLELHDIERSAVVAETDAVGRYLKTVFT